MIDLDGSVGEGGGQVLRTSLALALVTGKPFRLRNIRAGRRKPGLQAQHLTSVRAAAAIGSATVHGDSLHSTEITFEPGPVTPGRYHFGIGTAGATGLVLHTVYLPLALRGRAPSELTLEGGTHVLASPCFHFLDVTWRAYLNLLGLNVKLKMHRPGFYPRGGGRIEVHVQPCAALQPLHLTHRPEVRKVVGFSAVAGLPEEIARRQARRACTRLDRRGLSADIRLESWPGGPGTVLALVLEGGPVPTLFFGLGERGKPAERVADEAVDQALAYLDAADAPIDAHSADQIVMPLALAEGPSRFRVAEVTTHLATNIEVIRAFVDREITCAGAAGQPADVLIN